MTYDLAIYYLLPISQSTYLSIVIPTFMSVIKRHGKELLLFGE